MTPGATAEAPLRIRTPDARSRVIAGVAMALYVLLASYTAHRHEPWADEAQSWLLARDASLINLWTRLLHYEGTPGLWQTFLHTLIRLGLPYAGINYVSVATGAAGAWLVLRYAPWPLYIRVLLPFTYYLFFQYSVVARSYALLPLLTFACAMLWPNSARGPEAFTVVACLLAAVSLDGFVLACVIYGYLLVNSRGSQPWPRTGAASAFLVMAALLAWTAWPAHDNLFVTQFNTAGDHTLKFSLAMIQYAFTGEWVTTIAAIAMSLPFLFGGRTLWLFLAAAACLCVAHSLIYANVWHFGSILLAWLFCMWLAATRVRVNALAIGSFVLITLFQGYWAIRTAGYDWNHAYSGSREAAAFLKDHPEIGSKGLYLAGFSTEAVKPYFSAAELQHMTRRTEPAWWDWSVRGRGNDPRPLIVTDQFGYFMAGYKVSAEQAQWARTAAIGGYRLLRHFEGNLYWRTAILEPEAFDLYQRSGVPSPKSSIDIADPAAAGQLMNGFYDLEANTWRWTAGSFSVALARPQGADVNGARLALRLAIPETQIRDLGAMTLRAKVNGNELPAETFTTPGDLVYIRDVPAHDLDSAIIVVDFSFDKVKPPSGRDGRELGAIARGILLEKK